MMKAFLLLAVALTLLGCDVRSDASDAAPQSASTYRVRADFAVPLNADSGWAGAPGESVTVPADQPFRLRVALPGGAADGVGLQYRRNAGAWIDVEAHDFPYPERELELDFSAEQPGAAPSGWRVAAGEPAGLQIRDAGEQRLLHAQAGDAGLTALYTPPWALDEFTLAARLHLPADAAGVALVFGYVDEANHWRAQLDAAAGRVRIVRREQGADTVLVDRPAPVVTEAWTEFEVQLEGSTLEINVADDALEFAQPIDAAVPVSELGFHVPAGSSAQLRSVVIEGEPSTPRLSIVAATSYAHGDPAEALLGGGAGFAGGAGISMAPYSPEGLPAEGRVELEWPLVIRRFADAAAMNETGERFELRFIGGDGTPISGAPSPTLTLDVPAGHVGGTFVETPGRVGPWQASNGDLYFVIEPAESDNLFMMVKSTDGGQSWREVDGAGRPATGDLESVDGRQVDGTIHLVHQVTESVRYHAFRTSDHPTHPDTWAVTDELAASVTAIAQMASLVVRSDASLVAFHLGATVGYSVRAPGGDWGEPVQLDGADTAGPQAVLGADDTVHVAYYRMDGTLWHRSLAADGTSSEPRQLAAGAGTGEEAFGAVLPLVYLPGTGTLVIVYQLDDGHLWERRIDGDGAMTDPLRVTDRPVVRHAVDSQQPAADVVADGAIVRVLFADAADGAIYSTHDTQGWQPATRRVDGIRGEWVRGSVYREPAGEAVYGFVYDAGSGGGAGMNRFGRIVLGDDPGADG